MRTICIVCHGRRWRPTRRPRQGLHGNHSEERMSIKSKVNESRGDMKDRTGHENIIILLRTVKDAVQLEELFMDSLLSERVASCVLQEV